MRRTVNIMMKAQWCFTEWHEFPGSSSVTFSHLDFTRKIAEPEVNDNARFFLVKSGGHELPKLLMNLLEGLSIMMKAQWCFTEWHEFLGSSSVTFALSSQPRFHEKNCVAFARPPTEISGNGSQWYKQHITLNFFSWNRVVTNLDS